MRDKLIKGRDTMTEQSITGRTGSILECMGNRHYWRLLVMLPGEPCNCKSYAYQPGTSSGYSELVKEKNKTVDATKD